MGTTAQKLQKLLDSKAAIKAAIEAKIGGAAGDVMADYANQINSIPTPDYEVANIKLTTNQGTDYGFANIGGYLSSYLYDDSGNRVYYTVMVQVEGESEVRRFPWMGQTVTTLIPAGKKYTVDIDYADKPSGPIFYAFPTFKENGYTAIAGNVRNIIGVFSCEKITVKLVNEQQTALTGQNIEIITPYETYRYKNTASDFVFAIPTGSEYTIRFTIRNGYSLPTSQTYTASQQTREITGVYKLGKLGVFILDGSNNRIHVNDWSASMGAIGIVVSTSDCSFVVHPDGPQAASPWVNSKITNLNLTVWSSAHEASTGDFKGLDNTTELLRLSDAKCPANICNTQTINGVALQNCYLPAAGELAVIIANASEINEAISKIGKSNNINVNSYIWSSSYNGSRRFWVQYSNNSWTNSSSITTGRASYVIPIAELKSAN